MSSTAAEEIELLERVLLRLAVADTDEKLESAVGRFLTPVIIKITSPHENVRVKVMEVLTHIKRRVTSRPQVQIPVEALLDQYKASGESPFLQNFVIIFIVMGFPRLPIEKQTELASKLISCEEKLEMYQDRLFMLLLPFLGEIKLPSDPAKRKAILDIDDKAEIKKKFLGLLRDILLLPYMPSSAVDGLSSHRFKRIYPHNWKAEELEKIKQGIVRFISSGIFTDLEMFVPLVIASADTRFSVATPAIAELSKVSTMLDFSDPQVTEPLYLLFSGKNHEDPELTVTSCCARVRQKVLQYLIKAHGKGIDVPRGIQVIFTELFGVPTTQKCRVLVLQFCEKLIKDGPIGIISKVSKVILDGLIKLVGRESDERIEVQNAAHSALAQLSRTCPNVINQDLKIVLSYFNHLSSAPAELQNSIRDALVAMAPAFAYNVAMETDQGQEYKLDSQQHLLLAMLADNADSKLIIVQNVIGIFLTTCFPEHFPPARLLLLLLAGERNSLRETITSYLYGVSKRDQVNYNYLSSIDHPEESVDDFNKLSSEQRRVILPGFKQMVRHVMEVAQKKISKGTQYKNARLPVSWNVYEEILNYLRVCLWFSAGVKGGPGDEKNTMLLKNYIVDNFKQTEDNEVYQYLQLVQSAVAAQRDETNLLCLYDLLNAAPEVLCKAQMHLLESLSHSLKDVSEVTRLHVSQVYGILLAYGLDEKEFNSQIAEILSSLPQKSLENRHGYLMVLGHAYSRRIESLQSEKEKLDFSKSAQFIESVKLLVKMFCETQTLLVSAAIKGISMIGRTVPIPDFDVEISLPKKNDDEETMDEDISTSLSTKYIIFGVVVQLIRNSVLKANIREDAVKCLGSLAIGDGEHFTSKNLDKFLALVKVQKDVALNIAISEAVVATINGYHPNCGPPSENFTNKHCDEKMFENFLNSLIKIVPHPNPHSRQASAVWLLAIVKHCSHRPGILTKKQLLQYAFTELLSDESEFIQDVASRGLGLVYSLSDSQSQNDLANSLLDQLIGGKRKVNQVTEDTEIFPEGMLGKAPTGGNITTYKELCSLASDLNQPEMIYQFMQLANHNAVWTSKLGAAFGLKSISKDAKAKLQPYLGRIIPRLYRYKYDPTPKIQNSMISIWDSIVADSKSVVEQFYWEIFREILDNLTNNEWRVRIACCLAVRDLLRRPTGLRLRSDEPKKPKTNAMEVDDVPEPEIKEIWSQLFRVMDDIHEGTRLAAQGTVNTLSKICVTASSSDHGKSGIAVATSILPLLLETGVPHTVADIRKVSIQTISEMIDSSGALIAPHVPTLIPCLLKATGELESSKLSYMSTRLGAESEAQDIIDSIRAEAAKSHRTMETTSKCIQHIDYAALEKMTPDILELIKTSVNMGTKIACAHFICLISIRLGKEMTPLVGKYLGACFTGLKDRNATVRKYYASAIGHLVGIAKEQSIKNLFGKLDELYQENASNRGIVLTIQSINKRHNELLKDYTETVLPLIFFAMHEEVNEDNKSTVELWKDLWNEISPGDAGIRLNLNVIIPKLERSLDDASWLRKAQSANAINTIATRLSSTLEEADRLRLINILLVALQGRTFQGKERLLQALAALCKGLDKKHEITEKIIDAAFKECKKEEPQYRTWVLSSLGDILEELEADRFEEVYNMIWYLLDKKDLKNEDDDDEMAEQTADQRNKRAQLFNKLKETVCETLGKSWPKNSEATQYKFQVQFAERCSQCLKDNTRPVQVSLMVALTKFVERLKILEPETVEGLEKKPKVDSSKDQTVQKICTDVLAAVTYASGLPHTGLKKESLNIVLVLIKKLTESHDDTNLALVRKVFEESLQRFEKDSAPEVRCRIKDIEDKFSKIKN